MGKRIGMISLGCAKNQVNAEQMMYLLQQAGYELLSGVEGADVELDPNGEPGDEGADIGDLDEPDEPQIPHDDFID